MAGEKQGFLKNTLWSFLGQSATVIIGLVTNIILARILSPYEFGQVGIIMFFITVTTVFAESGLGGALVRKRDASPADFSTVFIFNIGISVICFLALLLSSGTIATYYRDPTLSKLIKVCSVFLLINAFNVVQNAKIYREMKFKRNLYVNIISVLSGSFFGICLAFLKYGVWSLVLMNLAIVTIRTGLLWYYEGGIGKMVFNKVSFRGLYRYGIYTTLISFLNTAFENIYQLLLGRYFSISQVGYFYQGKKIQSVPFLTLNSLSLGVVFAHLSKFQDNRNSFQAEYKRILSIFSITVGALASLVFLLARSAVHLLIGTVWLNSVVYIQLLSIASFFLLHKVFSQNILKVFDHTQKLFLWELISLLLQIATITIGIITADIKVLLGGLILANAIGYFINSFYSWRLLGLSSNKEVLFIGKIILASVVSAFICDQALVVISGEVSAIFVGTFIFLASYIIILRLVGAIDISHMFHSLRKLYPR